MARDDAGKWVARAGATGGGRTYRARRPYRWYSGLALIVVLGVFLVAYSRYERLHPVTTPVVAPTTSDHWVAGLVFDLCGNSQQTLAASPVEQSLSSSFYSSGDGVLQIQPKTSAQAGTNATLGKFTSQFAGLKFTSNSVGLPKKQVFTDGEKCPSGTPDAGKKGELTAKIWPTATATNATTQTGDLRTVRFLQTTELITVAFVPNGSAIAHPDGKIVTAVLNAQTATTTTTTAPTVPPVTSTTTSKTTTTTAKGTTSTTAAKTTTTTAKGTTTTTG
jgi:hypothetical protein